MVKTVKVLCLLGIIGLLAIFVLYTGKTRTIDKRMVNTKSQIEQKSQANYPKYKTKLNSKPVKADAVIKLFH